MRKRLVSSATASTACWSATGGRLSPLLHAFHQTCLAHLLRRCRTLVRDHEGHLRPARPGGAADSLRVRDRYLAGRLSEHGLAVARGHLQNQLDPLITGEPARRRAPLCRASAIEFPAVFSFLLDPTLDATNWRAEHALRPAVVTRKVCGGARAADPGREARAATSPRSRAGARAVVAPVRPAANETVVLVPIGSGGVRLRRPAWRVGAGRRSRR